MTISRGSLILLLATLAGCPRPNPVHCIGPTCDPYPYPPYPVTPTPDFGTPVPDNPDFGPSPDLPTLTDPFANIPSGFVSAKPASHDFATVSVGDESVMSFDLSIIGVFPNEISRWIVLDENLQPSTELSVRVTGCSGVVHFGDRCTATVTYAPTHAGPVKALLEVVGVDINSNSNMLYFFAVARLYGNGGAASTTLVADRTSYDFGNRQVGTTGSVTVGFTNSGTASTTPIITTVSGNGFTTTNNTCILTHLAPRASCNVTLQFAPLARQDYTGDVTVSTTNVATPIVVHVTGHGIDPAALQITTPQLASQFLGITSPEVTAHVSNSGSDPTGLLQVKLLGADAAAFNITSDGCGDKTLAGKGGCDVKVTFTPSERRNYAAQLVVTGMPGGSATADLSGRGLVHSTLVGENISWGNVTAGSSANVVFINQGDDDTGKLTAVLSPLGGPYSVTSDGCTGQVVSPVGSCTMVVSFAPNIVGTYDAKIVATGAAAGAAISTLHATFTSASQLRASPGSLEFGSAVYPSSDATVKLWNVGPGDLTLHTSIQTAPFVASPTSLTIAAGARANVKVTFTPPASAEYSDTLQLLRADNSLVAQVPLHGIGLWPAFDFTPATLGFGPITIGQSSDPLTVTVHNRSNRAWSTRYNLDDDDFIFVSTTCPGDLVPNASCTFTLVFGPRSVGSKQGTLSFPDAEAQPSLTLTGSGK